MDVGIVFLVGVVVAIGIAAAIIVRALRINRHIQNTLRQENSKNASKIEGLIAHVQNTLRQENSENASKIEDLVLKFHASSEASLQGGLKALSSQVEDIKLKSKATYDQIDALNSLHGCLKFRAPLPPFRGWSVSPDFANVLARYVLYHKPKTVIGLGSGISDIIVGYCIERNGFGKLISLEHSENYAAKTAELISLHGLESVIELRLCPLREYEIKESNWQWYDWDLQDSEDKIDLLIVDGPPGNVQHLARYPAIPLLRDRLNANCVVILDDTDRQDEKEIIDAWTREYGVRDIENVRTEKGMRILKL